jgi:single-stranded-DNA-specific exonuclease
MIPAEKPVAERTLNAGFSRARQMCRMHPVATPSRKTWRLLPQDAKAVKDLACSLQVPPLVAQLLLNRGIEGPEEARRFLNATLTGLRSPEALPGVQKAVKRILHAIEAGWRICIYGDYDVDGMTGSAILYKVLHLRGARARIYAPDRLSKGYGLNAAALRHIAGTGTKLVITVDCGIASLSEARLARELGLELIVTDHHEVKDVLPEARVLVHPGLPGGDYPFGNLCGAGVAFKLAWALAMHRCGGEKLTLELREVLLGATVLCPVTLRAYAGAAARRTLTVRFFSGPFVQFTRVSSVPSLWSITVASTPGVVVQADCAGLRAAPARVPTAKPGPCCGR